MKAGVALNPHTPITVLDSIIKDIDVVCVMSVNPGFGGQSFIPQVEKKVTKLRQAIDQQVKNGARNVHIQIDGGVKAHNIAKVQEWGVTNCVVGSGLFNDNGTVAENLAIIHSALQ